MKILIVEDEKDLQETIAEGLKIDGYAVGTCNNGEEAIEICMIENYDLIILDLNLPKVDGMKVLEEIRKKNSEIKILILSARNDVINKVNGLDLGANDYMTKPFEFAELEARIRNLLRRDFVQKNNILTFDKVKMDLSKHTVYIDGKEVILTKKEFSILEYFMLNPNKTISQEELIEHIWDSTVNSFSGAIRVHITALRKKIREIIGYDLIHTKIGVGYYLSSKGEMLC